VPISKSAAAWLAGLFAMIAICVALVTTGVVDLPGGEDPPAITTPTPAVPEAPTTTDAPESTGDAPGPTTRAVPG